jgi:hypothetical protein
MKGGTDVVVNRDEKQREDNKEYNRGDNGEDKDGTIMGKISLKQKAFHEREDGRGDDYRGNMLGNKCDVCSYVGEYVVKKKHQVITLKQRNHIPPDKPKREVVWEVKR